VGTALRPHRREIVVMVRAFASWPSAWPQARGCLLTFSRVASAIWLISHCVIARPLLFFSRFCHRRVSAVFAQGRSSKWRILLAEQFDQSECDLGLILTAGSSR
jgi:hypothetical protein